MKNNKQLEVKIGLKEYEICEVDKHVLLETDCDFCAFEDDGKCCLLPDCPLRAGLYFKELK